MAVILAFFLVGPLLLCGRVESQTSTDILKQSAARWVGTLTCEPWDCNCTFNRQSGCCCGANDLFQLEEELVTKLRYLWFDVSALSDRVLALSAGVKVAFKATVDPNLAIAIPGSTERCFGPFNTNVPVPFGNVTLNDGRGFSPSLGAFTAPVAGVYVFSFTVYSSAEESGRLYHKVQLMFNGRPVANVWENNREDTEDSASQVIQLELQKGDQVYVELISGRKLCKYLEFNIFTGYILYPYINQ